MLPEVFCIWAGSTESVPPTHTPSASLFLTMENRESHCKTDPPIPGFGKVVGQQITVDNAEWCCLIEEQQQQQPASSQVSLKVICEDDQSRLSLRPMARVKARLDRNISQEGLEWHVCRPLNYFVQELHIWGWPIVHKDYRPQSWCLFWFLKKQMHHCLLQPHLPYRKVPNDYYHSLTLHIELHKNIHTTYVE